MSLILHHIINGQARRQNRWSIWSLENTLLKKFKLVYCNMARPSKYANINLKQIEILAEKGFTDKEMSAFFSITEQTFNNYKKEHPEFFESLKRGKDIAD